MKRVLKIIITAFTFLLTACNPTFDKEYYQRVTGITFPQNSRIIESYDNGEFLTITSFQVDSMDLLQFVKNYRFDTLAGSVAPALWGIHMLKKAKPDLSNFKKLKYNMGTRGKTYWMYIVDEQTNSLWAQISYPDSHGD